jgi:hypothetical protein
MNKLSQAIALYSLKVKLTFKRVQLDYCNHESINRPKQTYFDS